MGWKRFNICARRTWSKVISYSWEKIKRNVEPCVFVLVFFIAALRRVFVLKHFQPSGLLQTFYPSLLIVHKRRDFCNLFWIINCEQLCSLDVWESYLVLKWGTCVMIFGYNQLWATLFIGCGRILSCSGFINSSPLHYPTKGQILREDNKGSPFLKCAGSIWALPK